MTEERAIQIVQAIHSDRWGWQGNTDKFFNPGEKQEVMDYWKTMPNYTCFADALYRMAKGIGEAK